LLTDAVKKLVTFAELVFTSTSFLVLLTFHMGSKIKSTPVRHRLSTEAKNLNIFGKLKNPSDSILKPEREDMSGKSGHIVTQG
jgi:hypothetical protein